MSRRVARSAEILDEADRFQTQLDFMLFHTEQNARIWAPRTDEKAWFPGDPLYARPSDFASIMGGQHIRPMIQELPIDRFHFVDELLAEVDIRCEDCQVGWDGRGPCWMCGTYDRPIGPRVAAYQSPFNIEAGVISVNGLRMEMGFQEFGVSTQEASESFQRFNMFMRQEMEISLAEWQADTIRAFFDMPYQRWVDPEPRARTYYTADQGWVRDEGFVPSERPSEYPIPTRYDTIANSELAEELRNYAQNGPTPSDPRDSRERGLGLRGVWLLQERAQREAPGE